MQIHYLRNNIQNLIDSFTLIWQWMICCMRKLLVQYVFHSLSFWIYEYSKENLPSSVMPSLITFQRLHWKNNRSHKNHFFHLAHHSYKINKTTINNDITRLQNIYSPLFSTIWKLIKGKHHIKRFFFANDATKRAK